MSLLIENHLPVVRFHGLNTAKDVSFTGSVTADQTGTSEIELDATGNQEIDATEGSLATIAPTANLTLTVTGAITGQEMTVVVTQGTTTSRTITFGTGFKPTGTLATGTTADRAFVLKFVSDGTNMLEVSRTTAIDVS